MEKVFTKENFEQDVINADKPVLIDFWAPWCGPCRSMGSVIEAFANEFEGRYVVGKINIDEEPELAERYRVFSIPTIMVFKDGQPTASTVGVLSREKLLLMLEV